MYSPLCASNTLRISCLFYTSQQYNYNLGASISLVLMVMILISMAIMNRFASDDAERLRCV